jgi:hypothetical protein
MKRDLARNSRTEVCDGSHNDNPEIPSEKVVINGQGKQGAEVRGQMNEHMSDLSEINEFHLTRNGANDRAKHMAN